MPDKITSAEQNVLLATWTKRCYLAGRLAMEAALRPHELGATQWYILHHLSERGSITQRELPKLLEVERANLSAVVTTMVRKGLIEQVADKDDQRQKHLRMTAHGRRMWAEVPNLSFIHHVALDGLDASQVATTISVMQRAVERLEKLSSKGGDT